MPILTGQRAWLTLAALITAFEAFCPESELMTASCARGMAAHPILTRAAIIITAAHLLGLIPGRIDPFTQTANILRRNRSRLAQAAAATT